MNKSDINWEIKKESEKLSNLVNSEGSRFFEDQINESARSLKNLLWLRNQFD